jgi:hypothetical protein
VLSLGFQLTHCSGSLSLCDSNPRTRMAHRPRAF